MNVIPSSSAAPWPDFPFMEKVDFADGDNVAAPPAGMAWTNSGALDSGNAASGTLSLDHDASNTNISTGPRLTATMSAVPGRGRCVAGFFSAADLDGGNEAIGVVLETAAGTNTTALVIRHDGANYQVQWLTDGGNINTANIAAGDVTGGVWLMLCERPQAGVGLTTSAHYMLGGTAAVLPKWKQWSSVHTALNTDGGNALDDQKLGVVIKTANTANTLTGDVEALWIGSE